MAQVQQLTPAQQQAAQNAKLQQANAQARALVLTQGYPMLQAVAQGTIDADANPVLNIPPQNVGLITGFLLKLQFNVTNGAGATALTLSEMGPANALRNIVFTDLQNYQRINTTGWHLHLLNTAKSGVPFFSSTPTDSPVGYGSNWPVIVAPATIAGGASGAVTMYYWIPVSYTSRDLSGAIYANVVNATMQLQLTLSNTAQGIAAAGTSAAFQSIYTGGNSGSDVGAYTYTLYQSYYDQLPQGEQGPILPMLDLNTMYEIKNTALTGLSQGQDFYSAYSNFRHFLSTTAVFDNGGTFNVGSDVNYWAFRTANMTDTRKADPSTWAAFTRQRIHTDMPRGVYYFDHREKPIYTTQYGNMNLILNPSTVNANARLLVGWEMLANVSNLINAGSLASAGS